MIFFAKKQIDKLRFEMLSATNFDLSLCSTMAEKALWTAIGGKQILYFKNALSLILCLLVLPKLFTLIC